ncbi:CoA transferase [Sphingomonas sp. YL-JM2C]
MSDTDNRPRFPAYRPRPADAPLALAGIRVVDFSRVLAGPWATQYLADMGADVIKVEEPSGDMSRGGNGLIQDGISGFFLCTNRNKRSIALDLATSEGQAVALDLITQADVVVENYTSRVMKGFGLDYASLAARFPRLVYCSISAYGRDGSLADAPGYDPIVAAESGLVALNAADGEAPFVCSLPIVDLTAAMNGAIAILGALMARERLGKGQFVETAMFDGALANLSYKGAEYLALGNTPFTIGRRTSLAPGGEFPTGNGSIWFAAPAEKVARAMICEVLDRPDLYADPRFSTVKARLENRRALEEEIVRCLAADDAENWAAKMKAARVPCGVIRTVAQAYHSPPATERELVREVEHPVIGRYADVASPIRMSLTPVVDPVAAPGLGAHRLQVLREDLGYDEGRILSLEKAGAFGRVEEATA